MFSRRGRYVAGSRHWVETDTSRAVIDCGSWGAEVPELYSEVEL